MRGARTSIVVPHLADTLSAIAEEGAQLFYSGELARTISDHICSNGGALTLDDMAGFEAVVRPSLQVEVGDWTIASNPPPAVGGSVLAAMLLACADMPHRSWTTEALDRLIRVQRATLDFRRRRLDLADDVGQEAAELLRVRAGRLRHPAGVWVRGQTGGACFERTRLPAHVGACTRGTRATASPRQRARAVQPSFGKGSLQFWRNPVVY